LAPATAAPEVSVIVPRIVPRSVPCPKADLATNSDKMKDRNTAVILLRTENLPRYASLRRIYHDKKVNATRNRE
jgi:hypothetical protein